MLRGIFHRVIAANERRLGIDLDYSHAIADANAGLLLRYNKIFGFLDPRKFAPAEAYHAARIRGALAADCGTCVIAEINLAKNGKLDSTYIDDILMGNLDNLSPTIRAVVELSDAVVRDRNDNPEAREAIVQTYGEKGLIELTFAMNGAALMPGIKRGMGYATACDLSVMRIKAKASAV